MENKIIEGNFIKMRTIFIRFILILLIVDVVAFFIGYVDTCQYYDRDCFTSISDFIYDIEDVMERGIVPVFAGLSFYSLLMMLIFSVAFKKSELVITDKRVYGKAVFGKRVDLPLDKVSAVGTSFLKGIDVGTSSGKIKFKLVKNQDEIHSALSKLLMERQEKENKSAVVENIIATSNADELKKFKELLDSGVITQEEFDAKKKQLLGL